MPHFSTTQLLKLLFISLSGRRRAPIPVWGLGEFVSQITQIRQGWG